VRTSIRLILVQSSMLAWSEGRTCHPTIAVVRTIQDTICKVRITSASHCSPVCHADFPAPLIFHPYRITWWEQVSTLGLCNRRGAISTAVDKEGDPSSTIQERFWSELDWRGHDVKHRQGDEWKDARERQKEAPIGRQRGSCMDKHPISDILQYKMEQNDKEEFKICWCH